MPTTLRDDRHPLFVGLAHRALCAGGALALLAAAACGDGGDSSSGGKGGQGAAEASGGSGGGGGAGSGGDGAGGSSAGSGGSAGGTAGSGGSAGSSAGAGGSAAGGSGGSAGSAGTGGSSAGAGGSSGGSGGSAGLGGSSGGGGSSSVPLVGAALDGKCPEWEEPGTGVKVGTELRKVTLSAYPNAVCNDGSPAIMYVRAASAPAAANSWIIHLQAGGSCERWEDCRDRWCSYKTSYDAAKMSSKFAPPATNGSGIFARNAKNDFGPANQVYVYYCSSDTWLGRKGDVVLNDPDGVGPSYRLHFRGFDIIEAVNDALKKGVTSDDGKEKLPSLSDATRILFEGSSAGSAGMTHALDWWAKQFPSAVTAGMFDSITDPLPEDVEDPNVASLYMAGIKGRFSTVYGPVFGAHLDESCQAAHPGDDAYLCSIGTHVRQHHVTTPYFVRQDLTDQVQFGYFGLTGATMNQFADALYKTMLRYPGIKQTAEEKVSTAPGVHVSNCGQHIVLMDSAWFGVAAQQNATVEGKDGVPITLHDALGSWLKGNAVEAIDTNPSSKAACIKTTPDL